MPQTHIIQRTGRLYRLKALLAEKRIVYLSAMFYTGKTVLLDQLAQGLPGLVLRFDAGTDDWFDFAARARAVDRATLLMDSLERLPSEAAAEDMAAFLSTLGDGVRAVLAGRAQLPAGLHKLCATGVIAMQDREFTLFDEEEIAQLFLDYGFALPPADIAYIKQRYWGHAVALHILARRLASAPGVVLRNLWNEVSVELEHMLASDVVAAFPEAQQALMFSLSPFEAFEADMARMVSGRTDAPRMLDEIVRKSYMLLGDGPDRYRFIPIARRALMRELKNRYTREYIDGLYRRAALYLELQNRIPEAISIYIRLDDLEKVRELLIRDTRNRPANGDYVELRDAYRLLGEETLMTSPELMKGICMIESLQMRAGESERWYARLKRFAEETPARDDRRRAAVEALAYLDITLPHRGSRSTLKTLAATAKLQGLTHSDAWRGGFNVAGNSVSLMNGGKDFCRWAPHGWTIYRLMKVPVELALGRGGSGLGDVAIGECELETNLTGDYGLALDKVCAGLLRASDDLEMRCAAVGIQSRIVAAQGNLHEALSLADGMIASLPPHAPARLRANLAVHRLTLLLQMGEVQEAMGWLAAGAPDETGDFNILDRYGCLLKLRLYIVTAQWERVPLLAAKLRQYFDGYDRPYMRIQLHLLQAVVERRADGGRWREELEAALALARRYRLVRVVADEGIAVVDMLGELELPGDEWSQAVLRLTRLQAARCPGYLRPAASRPTFTDREYQVYALLTAGLRNAKIASVLNISERTVKHYTAVIYKKLGVSSRAEALSRAAQLGDVQ